MCANEDVGARTRDLRIKSLLSSLLTPPFRYRESSFSPSISVVYSRVRQWSVAKAWSVYGVLVACCSKERLYWSAQQDRLAGWPMLPEIANLRRLGI
jgi:hypothetical protein